MGNLDPDVEQPQFAQLYVVDNETDARSSRAEHLQLDVVRMTNLQDALHAVNPFIQQFKSAARMAVDGREMELILKDTGHFPLSISSTTTTKPSGRWLLRQLSWAWSSATLYFQSSKTTWFIPAGDVVATIDQRRFNNPTASEVAGVLPDDIEEAESRDIVLQMRGGELHRIKETHASYDPLHFVLMFPHGDPGWHINIPHQDRPAGVVM